MHLFHDAWPDLIIRGLGEGGEVVQTLFFSLQPRRILAGQPAIHQHTARRRADVALAMNVRLHNFTM